MCDPPPLRVPRSPTTIVFHQAALGDFVLIWPRLRQLAAADAAAGGGGVLVVTHASMARLAERCLGPLGIRGMSIEQPIWSDLWRPASESTEESMPGQPGRRPMSRPAGLDPQAVTRVVSYVAEARSNWALNARRLFPRANIEHRPTRPPDRLDDPQEWHQHHDDQLGVPLTAKANASAGPTLVHAGAGSSSKQWPIDFTLQFVAGLRSKGDLTSTAGAAHHEIALIAGEAERARWSPAARGQFESAGGEWLDDLDMLVDRLLAARRYIGFDTGPTHLAAQLGLPTIALFGPTDATTWAPAGPRVHVIAPARTDSTARPVDMSWLTPAEAVGRVRSAFSNWMP